MANDTTDDTSIELPLPYVAKPTAAPPPRSTNATISGGNCSVYANGSPRSCYDCLNFAVDSTSAQVRPHAFFLLLLLLLLCTQGSRWKRRCVHVRRKDGCTLNLAGQCVLKSSVSYDSVANEASKLGKYCEPNDDKCYGCLRAFRAWSTCSNSAKNCICVRKCEPASRLTYDVDTSDSDASVSSAVTMGVVIGCVLVGVLIGCSCLAKRTRRSRRSRAFDAVLFVSSCEAPTHALRTLSLSPRTVCLLLLLATCLCLCHAAPVGSGYDAPPQQPSHAAYVAQCSPEVRIFQDAVVVRDADRFNSSSLPFARVVDTTPSAPPLEESIRAADAPSLETSAAARSTKPTLS